MRGSKKRNRKWEKYERDLMLETVSGRVVLSLIFRVTSDTVNGEQDWHPSANHLELSRADERGMPFWVSEKSLTISV